MAEEVLAVAQQFFEAGAPTLVSLISVLFDVPEATLPSSMLRTPLRAACTIWSWVRERRSMNRSQKITVASYTNSAAR